MRALALIVPGLLVAGASPASAQSSPFTIGNQLIAVFGEGALADSVIAVLTRGGFRAADRTRTTIEQARREGRQLERANVAIVVDIRPDPETHGEMVVAQLLDVLAVRKIRQASNPWPGYDDEWGPVLAEVITRIMTP